MADTGELLVGQPELAEQIMRALEIKGDLPQTIESQYGVGVQLDDFTRIEYAYLRRMTRWCMSNGQAAVAAQNSVVVWGPVVTGRSLIGMLELVTVINANAAAIDVLYGIADPTAGAPLPVASSRPLDDRQNAGGIGAKSGFGVNAAATATPPVGIGGRVLIPAGSQFTFNPGVVLTGASGNNGRFGFYVETVQLNVALTCAFVWRERQLLNSEL